MTTLYFSHNYIVAKVDELVSDILSPSYSVTIQQVTDKLNLYYQPMAVLYDDELIYTSSIEWFIGSCYLVCGKAYPDEVIWNESSTRDFLQALSSYQNNFSIAISNFAFQEQRNSQSLYEYLNYYLNEYARVLIVRVDLKVKQECAHLIDIETFHNLINDLRDKIGRKRGCFEHLRGHAWAIEQGVDTGGLHCHLLLIYNGDKRQKDWFLGDSVGKEWVEITDGLGCHYNCNTAENKRRYARKDTLGVAMIHKSNQSEVENAMNVALYLTRPDKFDQRLKAWLPNMRSFGRGTIDRS